MDAPDDDVVHAGVVGYGFNTPLADALKGACDDEFVLERTWQEPEGLYFNTDLGEGPSGWV